MPINNYVGVDMAKYDFYACLSEPNEPRKWSNDAKGINSFLNCLRRKKFTENNTVIGVESTASYHLRLCIRCYEAGYTSKIINPLTVKKQNQTELRRVKTDKHDSRLIRFCLVNGAGYEFNYDPEAIIQKNLIRQRDSLASLKLKLDRQQADIRLKEKCLKREINQIYPEIIDVLDKKIAFLKNELCLYRPQERFLLQSIPPVSDR